MMGQPGAGGYMPIYASAPNPYAPATPYAPAQPAQPAPFIPPASMLETPPAPQSQPLQPKTRPKHSHRAATTPLPLKSALKKTGAAGNVPSVTPEPHAESSQLRRRTNSKVKPDQYAAGVPPNQAVEPAQKGESCSSFFALRSVV
jgi:hypothetical protein